MLFTEASEGGAGVLRLLQSDPTALRTAAATALEICHFAPDGTDLGGPHPDRPCARGCYDCLLTYGNQVHHGAIDRHSVRDLLLRFANADVVETGRGETRTEQLARLAGASDTKLEEKLLALLKERGLRLPDEAQPFIDEALARPDFVYRLPGANVAIFVDGPVHEYEAAANRDRGAEDRLFDRGWDVIRFPDHGGWAQIIEQNPRHCGPRRGGTG